MLAQNAEAHVVSNYQQTAICYHTRTCQQSSAITPMPILTPVPVKHHLEMKKNLCSIQLNTLDYGSNANPRCNVPAIATKEAETEVSTIIFTTWKLTVFKVMIQLTVHSWLQTCLTLCSDVLKLVFLAVELTVQLHSQPSFVLEIIPSATGDYANST